MTNVIKEIEKFQKDRLLDKQQFDANNEAVNILEEILESFGYDIPSNYRSDLFNILEENKFYASTFFKHKEDFKTENIVDAYADIIVFSIGAIMKLGYDPEKVLNEVAKEINSRTGSIIDGKFVKDKDVIHYQANFDKCKIDKGK